LPNQGQPRASPPPAPLWRRALPEGGASLGWGQLVPAGSERRRACLVGGL